MRRERTLVATLQTLNQLRALQKDIARAAALEAARIQTEREASHQQSRTVLDNAAKEWGAVMERKQWHPEDTLEFASHLISAEEDERGKRHDVLVAEKSTQDRQKAFEANISALGLSASLLKTARRKLFRRQEEKRLEELEDRITYEWLVS